MLLQNPIPKQVRRCTICRNSTHELWRIVCILGQLDEEDFGKADKVRESWLNRLTRKRKVNVNPITKKELYGIVKLIEQLPNTV